MNASKPIQTSRPVSVNSADPSAAGKLRDALLACMEGRAANRELVLLCIGTDRATGDSLGPLTGHKLSARARSAAHITVYGTLESPIHAKNLEASMTRIQSAHNNPFIVAIDACLGKSSRVGWLTVSCGPVRPGAALQKALPDVGDVAVMGVVNLSGMMELLVLQNTRLHTVMCMADIIADGIGAALGLPGGHA